MKRSIKSIEGQVGVDGYKSNNKITVARTKTLQSVWTGTIRVEMDKKGRETDIYRVLPTIRNKYTR